MNVAVSFLLARAEGPDLSDSSLVLVLTCAGLVLGSAVLSLLPVFIARGRGHRQLETITAVAVLWGLLTAGTLVHASIVQMQWSKEQLLRIQSGYLDPQDTSDAPAKPWRTWTALAAAYCALIAWAFAARSSANSGPPQIPPRDG
ncbi:MAG: hypothetical protein JWN24_3483 [Phycisphaerales bacterium]|nr:hypothetical protein [Phycisphaerales bacterium]